MVYRPKSVQLSIESFGSVLGCPLSADNEWVQLANQISWTKLEAAYQSVFPSNLGRAGKPFRMLYGAWLLMQRQGFTDREVVDAIRDIPVFQCFRGMPEYVAV